MDLIGLMLVRNESWILNFTARVALRWCDKLAILDHGSTDTTSDIIRGLEDEFPGRIVHDFVYAQEQWREMENRQWLLELGRNAGGTHFAMIDADEILTANLLPDIRGWANLAPGKLLALPMIAPWRGIGEYRDDDSVWSHAYLTCVFGDRSDLCWRPREGDYQHHKREPFPLSGSDWVRPLAWNSKGGVMHLQWLDWERVKWKHRRYKMLEAVYSRNVHTIKDIDRIYSEALNEIGIKTRICPPEWLDAYRDIMPACFEDKEPWFKLECEKLWAAHGAEKFEGLTLWNWPNESK